MPRISTKRNIRRPDELKRNKNRAITDRNEKKYFVKQKINNTNE